jgi:hypothetical protein
MSTRARLFAFGLGGLGLASLGCSDHSGGASPPSGATSRATVGQAPADSLVATAPGGAQIWFTLARNDSGPGIRCVARAVEIRRGATRIPVPLLYTTTRPQLIGDTAMRARLSQGCRPGDSYLVDLRTGRPVREHS